MPSLRKSASAFAFLCLAAAAAALIVTQSPELLPRTRAAEASSTPAPTPLTSAATVSVDRSGPALQCAIYARQRTGIVLTGAARSWWPQAEGRYRRAATPSQGAVIVMGGTEAGHVAVVTRVVNARQIVIDHANWLGTGEIITGALVEDASANNDWTSVRVWNVETNSMGLREYPVFGFVGPGAA
jgi:surface antigen